MRLLKPSLLSTTEEFYFQSNSVTGQQHVFQGINSFKVAVPFPKFPFNFGRSVQFKYKKIVTYEEFFPNMCIIYLFQHVTF